MKIEALTKELRLAMDGSSGVLTGFEFRKNGLNPWRDVINGEFLQERKGGVRILDELTGRVYADDFGSGSSYYHEAREHYQFPTGTPSATWGHSSVGEGEGRVSRFVKRFQDAPFVLNYTLSCDEREARWDVEAVLDEGEPDRSLRVELCLPTLAAPSRWCVVGSSWRLWAPVAHAPFAFMSYDAEGHSSSTWDMQRFTYEGNSGNGVCVPLIDIYSDERDVGLAFSAPFDLHKPSLEFEVDKKDSQVRLVYGDLGLRRSNNPKASVVLHAHGGDWRPALGWFFDKHRDYFTPGDPKIVEQEGGMSHNDEFLTEATIEAWKSDMNFKWIETRHANVFGDLVPEADEWTFVSGWKKDERGEPNTSELSKRTFRQYLRRLKKHDVSPFLYFNLSDCERNFMEERGFQESVIELHGGIPLSWNRTIFNSREVMILDHDPDSPWGRHVLAMLEAMFDAYPEADGIMLDQMGYRSYDFTKDDGATMKHNRPCYDTHLSTMRMMPKIVETLRRRGKTVFANGTYNVEIQKGVDGVMCEGCNVMSLAQKAYLTLAKPLMILTGAQCPLKTLEKVMRACLKYGAFPSVRDHVGSSKARKRINKHEKFLYSRYMPLLEPLRGRKWVFQANALTLPEGYDGNIFENPEGRLVVTFFPREALSIDRRNGDGEREIILNLPDGMNPDTVSWLRVESRSPRTLPLNPMPDGRCSLKVGEYTDASTFVI